MALTYPRRVTSTATTITVTAPADGTAWVNSPATYKGNQTFNSLTSVKNSINATTGGWAQLSGTTLSTAFQTAGEIDAISPRSVLRQNHWPAHWNSAWGGGAWNGYGWWLVDPGGHFAGYMNATFMLRLADPVGPVRVHNTAPVEAAWRRDTSVLVDPSGWSALAVENASSSLEWGPRGAHQYQGLLWDAEREILIVGGNSQVYCTNPTAIGETRQYLSAIYKFNPNAASPRSAWMRTTYQVIGGADSHTLVKNPATGLIHWRTVNDYGSGRRFSWNPDGGAPYIDTPPYPSSDVYTPWRTGALDPATDKWYELQDRVNDVDGPWRLYEYATNGAMTLVANVESAAFWSGSSNDCLCAPVIVNSKAYLIQQASGVTAGNTLTVGVTQVNLATKTVENTYIDATAFSVTSKPGANIGFFNRVAWVPQAGVFVLMIDASRDVWVFRPPASWGL